MKQIFISGANRGIGLEMTRRLLDEGQRVFAGCRQPGNAADLQALKKRFADQLLIVQLDVMDDASVLSAWQAVNEMTDRLDWLVNNAGILVRGESLEEFDPQIMRRTFDTNVTGVLRVTSQFVDLLRRGEQPKLINITSQLGSLARARPNQLYSYNSSKAALNMVTRMLAQDLHGQGITVVAVHPGWVQTDMGGQQAAITPQESAAGIIKVAQGLNLRDSNQYLDYLGDVIPW